VSTIGTNVRYAGIHEFGGTFNVRQHTRKHFEDKTFLAARRKQKFLFRKKLKGEDVESYKALKEVERAVIGRQLDEQRGIITRRVQVSDQQVSGYTRSVPERAPIRRGVEECIPNYSKSIINEVKDYVLKIYANGAAADSD
jgi:hypothetical protein